MPNLQFNSVFGSGLIPNRNHTSILKPVSFPEPEKTKLTILIQSTIWKL